MTGRDDLTLAERLALDLRAQVNRSGACVCGATWSAPEIGPGEVAHVHVWHEHDCPVVSPAVRTAVAKVARRRRRRSGGRRHKRGR